MVATGVPSPLTRLASYSTGLQQDPPAVAALKHELLLAAMDKSPRLRNDLDLLVITQFLAPLESLAHVSAQAIHYLATECTLLTLRDGDVFCYQEDAVRSDSAALVIVEGSLCGYVNKPFSQREDARERFFAWNARQNRRRGVLVDFGEIQATYAAGALCGFDDVLVGVPHAAGVAWQRRKGIHAQEQTRAVALKKDTLDRAAHRFGLSFEPGFLHSQRESASTDVTHLALFSPFSEPARQALFQSAPRRLVPRGDTLFASSDHTSTVAAFVIVLSGRLDIFWTAGNASEAVDEPPPRPPPSEDETATPASSLASAAEVAPPPKKLPHAVFARSPLFSIRRGQTIGDQTIGLALDARYAAAADTSAPVANVLPIRIVSGEDTTEVLLLPLALYREKRVEDQALLEYAAQLKLQRQQAQLPAAIAAAAAVTAAAASPPSPSCRLLRTWAPAFFAAKAPLERSLADLQQLLWRLHADSVGAKVFFQFPPLVLERLCHAMELVQLDAKTPALLLDGGGDTDELYVVLHGALRCSAANSEGSEGGEASHEVFLPGDVFGLAPRGAGSSAVYADADTMLATVPRACVERWLAPVKPELLVDAGRVFAAHEAFLAAHPPRVASSHEKRKSLTATARRVSALAAAEEPPAPALDLAAAAAHTDALATVLSRMGVLRAVPHFLLRELLAQTAVVRRQPGDVVVHENEPSTALVVVLSGFVRVFSLEHMGAALDMFRQHAFCQFASLHHLLAKQQSLADDEGGDARESGDSGQRAGAAAPPVLARHRSAMYGVHLQTLHAGNAFRVGVLGGHTRSPATVTAQTPCELLLVDEAAYSELLSKHAPPVDLARYAPLFNNAGATPTDEPPRPSTGSSDSTTRTTAIAGGARELAATTAPPALLRFVETTPSPLAWLSRLTPPKRTLLLRHAKLVSLQPGERLLRHGEPVDHVFLVVAGGLALYVREHHERVATALDASQRSVRSLMLERNVTSNYSTTSHQLSAVDAVSASPRLQRKRALLQHKVTRMVAGASAPAPSPQTDDDAAAAASRDSSSSLFVHSVLAAVRENKKRTSVTSISTSTAAAVETTRRRAAVVSSPPPTLTFQSAVSRATLAHRLDQRRGGAQAESFAALHSSSMRAQAHAVATTSASADERGGVHGRALLCYLHAGDVYGEEALAHTVFRSPHDVLADTCAADACSAGAGAAPASGRVELLAIDRAAFLGVLATSDDEAELELRARARAAKSKWQLAEQLVVSTRKASTMGIAAATATKTPKLFDLFKNILNQRYLLTMRAIAELPMLQGLSDDAKREICVGARFETLDRFANAFKDDGRAAAPLSSPPDTGRLRYYFVLGGRVGLFPKNAVHGGNNNASSGNNAATGPHATATATASSAGAGGSGHSHFASVAATMELCLQEVGPGRGFGEFELLVPEASRHHVLAVALEPTTLLSLPGALFLKFWPQADDVRRHIAYLRHGVRFFQRLEMEKIASLYHALRSESFDRGAKILEQQQPVGKSEIVLLKEGECSIKSTVTIETHAPTHHSAAVRVLATIADVRAGHVFWLDGARVPFALEAISARVGVARIGVDKLRLILPKAHLQQLEEHSGALAALVREQLAAARATIVRVMNDKRDAERGRRSGDGPHGTFLPSLHYALQGDNPRGEKTAPAERSGDDHQPPAIPYARILSSQPVVDLVRPSREEWATRDESADDRADGEAGDGDDGSGLKPFTAAWRREVDLAYREAHQLEHYELADSPSAMPLAATLRGSFPDDPTLRRSRWPPHTTARPLDSAAAGSASPAKEDAVSAPETTTAATPPRLQLQVTLPRPSPRTPVALPAATATTPTPAASRKGKHSVSFVVEYYGDPAELEQLNRDAERGVDLVVDLRAQLQAELQAPFSPLRSIRLEPSQCKLHSQGKSCDGASPPTEAESQRRFSPRPPAAGGGDNQVLPGQVEDVALSPRWSATPPPRRQRPVQPGVVVVVSPPAHPPAGVIQKRGFLHVLRVPREAGVAGFAQTQFLRCVVHRQQRRLFSLEDAILHEYAEDSDVLRDGPIHSISLAHAELCDAPTVDGENAALLRQSFVLTAYVVAGTGATLLLTGESAVDKKSWMRAIRTASAMGAPPPLVATASKAENSSPGSPSYRHRQPVAASLAQHEHRRLTATGSGGRNAVIQSEEVLEVEYRIRY